jgi:hypothetical protein
MLSTGWLCGSVEKPNSQNAATKKDENARVIHGDYMIALLLGCICGKQIMFA